MKSTPLLESLLGPKVDPADVTSLVILSQTSHNDWDWNSTFDTFYDGSPLVYHNNVKQVFDAAFLWMQQQTTPPNLYSICEMAFLRRYYEDPATPHVYFDAATLANLRISGGGLTSPSNLQPHGESYFRDFLIGRLFTATELGLVSRDVWVPDDFGHDPQTPVTLEAMGMCSIGFARLPGGPDQWGTPPAAPALGSPVDLLQKNKALDFDWVGYDGSKVRTHWLQGAYSQGLNIIQGGRVDSIKACYDTDQPVSPTPFVYVPISDDMLIPNAELTEIAAEWNGAPQVPGVYCVIATFQEYQQLLEESGAQLPTFRNDQTARDFFPIPYLVGCNAVRPALKTLHFCTAHTLLAAETFAAALKLLGGGQGMQTNLTDAWDYFVPSNHHAYITGCATQDVTNQEQLPRLQTALTNARASLEKMLETISAGIDCPADQQPAFAIFNPCGFARDSELVALSPAPPNVQSVNGLPVQRGANGELLFLAAAPSMGWSVAAASTAPPSLALQQTVSVNGNVLENAFVSAAIDPKTGDLASIGSPGGSSVLSGAGNQVFFINDDGDYFGYGFEPSVGDNGPGSWTKSKGSFESFLADAPNVSCSIRVLEKGPLRASIETSTHYTIDGGTQNVTRIYTLVAGDPVLRMKTTTGAPAGKTAMVSFPLVEKPDLLAYGTPTHWTDDAPSPTWQVWGGWDGPMFKAAHNYFMPRQGRTFDSPGSVTFYHLGMRAWGMWNKQAILTLVRNNTHGAWGDPSDMVSADPGVYELEYALAVGHASPLEITPLRESLKIQRPMLAKLLTGQGGELPQTFSLVSVANESRSALVAAAKLGAATAEQAAAMKQKAGIRQATEDDLIFRIYVPTPPGGETVNVTLGRTGQLSRANALEEIIDDTNIDASNLPLQRCLTTYRVSYVSRPR